MVCKQNSRRKQSRRSGFEKQINLPMLNVFELNKIKQSKEEI